jgi:iron complex transport system substrate-binding protein
MTLNDRHIVSAAIRICGGQNIFGKQPQLTPTIGIEAVLKADPEAIFFGSREKDESLAYWQRFPKLTAIAHGNLFPVNSDLLARPGPRILDGAEALCKQLDAARGKRK